MAKHPMVGRYGPRRAWWPWEDELLRGAIISEDEGDENAVRDCAELLCRSHSSVVARVQLVTEQEQRALQLASIRNKFGPVSWLSREAAPL
jgi:hypothetical protein